MIDAKEHRRETTMRLLSSPWHLAPLAAGATLLLGLWTFSWAWIPGIVAGVGLIFGAFGVFATRWLTGLDAISKRALEELREREQRKREARLDELERCLEQDGDPRTEGALRDLRTIVRAFRDNKRIIERLNTRSAMDLLQGADLLFERCVDSLERSLELHETANQLSTPEAREPIEARREAIVADVGQSIAAMGKILVGAQSGGATAEAGKSQSELAEIRRQLDESLEVARRVDARMRSLDAEGGEGDLLNLDLSGLDLSEDDWTRLESDNNAPQRANGALS